MFSVIVARRGESKVGLAAPMLGAPGPLRSVLSGENMGLPFTDEEARGLELCECRGSLSIIANETILSLKLDRSCRPAAFGSTSNVNPISTKVSNC